MEFNNFIVTPQSTLRAAEGELIPFLGEEPTPFIPLVWTCTSPGIIEYATDFEGCRYQARVSQTTIGKATEELKLGVYSLTVSNMTSTELPVSFWIAWRHESFNESMFSQTQGISLKSSLAPSQETVPSRPSWDPKWVWYFDHQAFIREEWILYYVMNAKGWNEEKWVRRPEKQYKDLSPNSILGYRHFSNVLSSKGKASLQIYIPFIPASTNLRDLLASISGQQKQE